MLGFVYIKRPCKHYNILVPFHCKLYTKINAIICHWIVLIASRTSWSNTNLRTVNHVLIKMLSFDYIWKFIIVLIYLVALLKRKLFVEFSNNFIYFKTTRWLWMKQNRIIIKFFVCEHNQLQMMDLNWCHDVNWCHDKVKRSWNYSQGNFICVKI